MHESIQEGIEKHGYTLMGIGTGRCDKPGCECGGAHNEIPFFYTVGLTERGLSEVIISGGLHPGQVNAFIREYLNGALNGKPSIGTIEAFAQNPDGQPLPARAVPLENDERIQKEVGCQAFHYYEGTEHKPQFIQLVWPDEKGLFSDDPDYNTSLLGRQELFTPDETRYEDGSKSQEYLSALASIKAHSMYQHLKSLKTPSEARH